MHKIITIDGPAGVGKGTICKLLSKSLDAPVLNSGEIYRSIAHDIKENHINPDCFFCYTIFNKHNFISF